MYKNIYNHLGLAGSPVVVINSGEKANQRRSLLSYELLVPHTSTRLLLAKDLFKRRLVAEKLLHEVEQIHTAVDIVRLHWNLTVRKESL